MLISTGYNGWEKPGLAEGRVGLFVCECGCGQTFFANYRTRMPRYANKTHRARAYRARSRARAMAYQIASKTPGQLGVLYEEYYQKYLDILMQSNRGRD
jgi:hypothetical protein